MFRSLLAVIHLSSWILSIGNITSSSVHVQWADFPLNVSISHFMVMFTEENKNISVLFQANSLHDRSFFVSKLLKPFRVYSFQVLAFTGSIENDTYSTEIKAGLTGEGGKTCLEISNWLGMNGKGLFSLASSPRQLKSLVVASIKKASPPPPPLPSHFISHLCEREMQI